MATKTELQEEIEALEDLCAAVVDVLTDPSMVPEDRIGHALELLEVDDEADE